jgi:hypothetical protein
MKPLVINCAEKDWEILLKRNLQEGIPVKLDNFDYEADGQFCELLAVAHTMDLRLDTKNKAGLFRKRTQKRGDGN